MHRVRASIRLELQTTPVSRALLYPRAARSTHAACAPRAPTQINLLRRPPFGYEEPSVSPRRSCSALNLNSGLPSAPKVKSWLWSWPVHPCLTPMAPSGWNTCEKLVAPSARPQSRMAAATENRHGASRSEHRAPRYEACVHPRAMTGFRKRGMVRGQQTLIAGSHTCFSYMRIRTLVSFGNILCPCEVFEQSRRLAVLCKELDTRSDEIHGTAAMCTRTRSGALAGHGILRPCLRFRLRTPSCRIP